MELRFEGSIGIAVFRNVISCIDMEVINNMFPWYGTTDTAMRACSQLIAASNLLNIDAFLIYTLQVSVVIVT
jgi:hypothetical protein